MAKKKPAPENGSDDVDDPAEQGAFQILYDQDNEAIVLSFHDAERRDAELQRLRGTGIVATRHDAE